jgi:hypothetical protein
VSAAGYAADALLIGVGWFAVFAAARGRFLPTWLGGTTLGVALRMLALGHERASEAAFWLVALAFLAAASGLLRTALARTQPRRRTAR